MTKVIGKKDSNILDKLMISWVKSKYSEIDALLGEGLLLKGYNRDSIEHGAITLTHKVIQTKKGDNIIRYVINKIDGSEVKLLEVQITNDTIKILK